MRDCQYLSYSSHETSNNDPPATPTHRAVRTTHSPRCSRHMPYRTTPCPANAARSRTDRRSESGSARNTPGDDRRARSSAQAVPTTGKHMHRQPLDGGGADIQTSIRPCTTARPEHTLSDAMRGKRNELWFYRYAGTRHPAGAANKKGAQTPLFMQSRKRRLRTPYHPPSSRLPSASAGPRPRARSGRPCRTRPRLRPARGRYRSWRRG